MILLYPQFHKYRALQVYKGKDSEKKKGYPPKDIVSRPLIELLECLLVGFDNS